MNSTKDPRRNQRCLCAALAEISVRTTGTDAHAGASHVALVTDIGVNGMRVSMDELIAVDAEVVVKVPGKIELVGTIRYVRQYGREYIMGIGFTDGAWNEQSDWPQHRAFPEQERRVCDFSVGEIDYAATQNQRNYQRAQGAEESPGTSQNELIQLRDQQQQLVRLVAELKAENRRLTKRLSRVADSKITICRPR